MMNPPSLPVFSTLSVRLLPLLMFMACFDPSSGSGADTASSGADTSAAGLGQGGGAEGEGEGEGEGEPASASLEVATDPCNGEGTPYDMLFDTEDEGYLGCGNGVGLWHTSDGGERWERAHPSGDLFVFDLDRDARGRLLVCGHDYEGVDDGTLLSVQEGDTFLPLLSYGNNSSDDRTAYLSNCGAVEAIGDRLVVASNTGPDLSTSEDGGATWTKESRTWEAENYAGERAVYTLISMTQAGGQLYGGGSVINEPPVFFGPDAAHPDALPSLAATVISDRVEGEVWAMASPDGGSTWLVGGRDQSRSSSASGFLYRSTDRGETWTAITLGDGLDIVHGLAFSADGQRGLAVGHRYPISQGGFVLLTEDGGQTWTELEADLPLLQTVTVKGDRWYIAGDAYFARGSF